MTLIIGIKCKDAIVLAGDSQATTGNAKQTDQSKIEVIPFQNLQVLAAQSGHLILTNRLLDLLRKKAHAHVVTAAPQVGELLQGAMHDLRTELRQSNLNCTAEELNSIILKQGFECEVMVGFFWANMPHIYTIDIAFGVFQRVRGYCEAIGCGAMLGKHLLSEHATEGMDSKFGSLIAVYIVEKVKKFDAYCGGPTVVGRIGSAALNAQEFSGPIIDAAAIQELAILVEQADKATKQERTQKLHKEFLGKATSILDMLYLDM